VIGPGLKKLGQEWNLKPSGGRLCGVVGGFPAALWEGMGYKAMTLNLGSFAKDGGEKPDAAQLITRPQGEYRIIRYEVKGNILVAIFYDNPGTMKRIRSYVETELPALRAAGFSGAARCGLCDEPMGDEAPSLMMLGDGAIAVHPRCVDEAEARLDQMVSEANQGARAAEMEAPRSSPLAPFGALLGGLIGAVPWVILSTFGYVWSFAAMLIALGANFGHKLLGGRPGKKRMVLVIALTILLVPVAQVAGIVGQMAYEIHTGALQESWEIPRDSIVASDAPGILLEIFNDSEGRAELLDMFLRGLGQAYLFTALGLFGVWRMLSRENLPPRPPQLSRIP